MFLCGYVPVLKTGLKYRLEKADSALVFQVLEQSADITAFLSRGHFLSQKTGFRIAIAKYPELKDSKNVIFLRGSDTSNDYKPDVTRFPGNMQRDNKADLVNTALTELVDAVKSVSYAIPVKVARPRSNKNVFVYSPYAYKAPKTRKAQIIVVE